MPKPALIVDRDGIWHTAAGSGVPSNKAFISIQLSQQEEALLEVHIDAVYGKMKISPNIRHDYSQRLVLHDIVVLDKICADYLALRFGPENVPPISTRLAILAALAYHKNPLWERDPAWAVRVDG